MARSWFISGTDTDIGKTCLTAALALASAESGSVSVQKPIQTGAHESPSGWSAPDLVTVDALARSLDVQMQGAAADRLPYAFTPACSPHLAAAEADRPICVDRIARAYRRLCSRADTVWVEGAGGLRVPVGPDADMIDIALAILCPVILAVRPGLGTLNHTLLSIDVMAARGVSCAGWVIVHRFPPSDPFIEEDNRAALMARCSAPYLGEIPYLARYPEGDSAPNLLEAGRSIWQKLLP